MKIEYITINGMKILEVTSEEIVIKNLQDALDLLADGFNNGSRRIILKERNLTAEFFDLKTGIAGEILQKFATYNMLLAIVGDFSKYTGKSLRDLIYESNKGGRIIFISSAEEAKEKLTRGGTE